jgi:threonine dehydrogenase-like Zn-dependent dehydrogenase
MKSLFYIAPNKLEFRNVPDPLLIAPGDALVRPIVMTTCDIDPIFIKGELPIKYPFPIGHEAIGRVIEIGSGVEKLRVGDTVVLSYYEMCGTCARCHAKRPNRCLEYSPDAVKRAWHGVGLTNVGYFSELVRVPNADFACTLLLDDLDPTHLASLGDNIGFAYEYVIPHLEAKPGSDVLIMGGGGSIGIYAAAFAVAGGAASVTYADWSPDRLALAEGFGANVVEGKAWPKLGSFPIVVDASANTDSLLCALRSTEVEGQLSSVGGHFAPVSLPLFEMYVKGINFYTGPGSGIPNVKGAMAMIRAKGMDISSVTSIVAPLDQAVEVLSHPPLKAVLTAL